MVFFVRLLTGPKRKTKDGKLVVRVRYCGEWGNEIYYQQLRDFLSSEPAVAEKIKVEPKEDRQVTGNFEVTIGRDVLHSKKRGMGRTETQEERDAILEKIKELIITDE